MTEELQPLSLQGGEAKVSDLSTPESLNRFKKEFIGNAAKGREMDRLRYFQDLLILDVSGVLEQDPNLQAAVIKSGQDPLIWQGVYEGVKNSAEVLQNPDASPEQKQIAQQNLRAYFRVAEVTQMNTAPSYQNPGTQAKVYPVWQATWNNLNSWRTLLEEAPPERSSPPSSAPELAPAPVTEAPAAEDSSEVEQLFGQYRDIQRRLTQGEDVPGEEFNTLDRRVSEVLNLPPDINFENLEREIQRNEELRNYPTASVDKMIAFLKANPEHFQRIFTFYFQDLVERVERQQPGTPEYAKAAQEVEGIIKRDAHVTDGEIEEEEQAHEVFNGLNSRFFNLIAQEPPVIMESLIEVFSRRSRAWCQATRLTNQILQKKADLFTSWAESRGLRVVGFDENGQIRLEEINQAESASVQTPASIEPRATDLTSPETKDAHTLLAKLRQLHQRYIGMNDDIMLRQLYREIDQLQLQLSQTLGLSEDESPISRAAVLEYQNKRGSYFIADRMDEQLRNLISPLQIELARELFAQGPPELQGLFDEFQKKVTPDAQRYLERSMEGIIERMAMGTHFYSEQERAEATKRGRRYLNRRERLDYSAQFWAVLLKEPSPSDDELIQAFIKNNQAERDNQEVWDLERRAIHQYMTGLAHKAGLEIVNKGPWQFELVRKNPPPLAPAAEPASVPLGTGPPAITPTAEPTAPDSKTHKLSLIEQIQEVVHIERGQAPDLTGGIRGKVEELEEQVTARSIYGKFPPEVRIKSQVFHHDNTDDFTDYGDAETVGSMRDRDRKVHIAVLGTIYSLLHSRRDQSSGFREFAKKHFLMAVNIPGTQDAVLSYQFLQNWSDSYRRAASVVAMNFRLRRESAYRLLDLVREDPEAAEMFLQKAANGFEAGDPNLPKVGIPRVRAEEIVILNLDRLNPDYFNRKIYTDPGTIAEAIQDPNGQIAEAYKYSSPHGIADPNTIPL